MPCLPTWVGGDGCIIAWQLPPLPLRVFRDAWQCPSKRFPIRTQGRTTHRCVECLVCARGTDRQTDLPRVMHLRDARSRLRYVFVGACFALSDSSNVFLCQGLARAMCSPCSSSLPHAPRLGAWILDRATYIVAYRLWARHTPTKPIASPATQRSWGLLEGLGLAANDSSRI